HGMVATLLLIGDRLFDPLPGLILHDRLLHPAVLVEEGSAALAVRRAAGAAVDHGPVVLTDGDGLVGDAIEFVFEVIEEDGAAADVNAAGAELGEPFPGPGGAGEVAG